MNDDKSVLNSHCTEEYWYLIYILINLLINIIIKLVIDIIIKLVINFSNNRDISALQAIHCTTCRLLLLPVIGCVVPG